MNNISELYEPIIRKLDHLILVINQDLKCLTASDKMFQQLGFSIDTPSESLSIRITGPSLSEACQQLSFSRGDGTEVIYPVRVRLLSNGYFLIEVNSDEASSAVRFHSQRLETLGMLAGGVAHDFNNVLAGILGHITYLTTILPQTGKHVESLNAIEEGANKASFMTQQILNFSRLQVSEVPTPVHLNVLLRKTFQLLRGAISPEYNMHCEFPEQDLFTLGVEGKLAQVVVNLVMNARDALNVDGNIVFRLQKSSKAGVLPTEVLSQMKVEAAVLQIEDDGHGMSPEVLARAFEPYFSTKADKGNGLGLATVGQIVDQMGARILVDSKESQGTTFSVILPLCSASAEDSSDIIVEPTDQLPGGDERVLIVDDEDPVRNVLSMSLKHLGYTVDVAESGDIALKKYDRSNGGYDLVILDMLMPHLSGEQVFFALKERNPDIAVLLISGYSSEDSVKRILTNGGKGFIQKPFTIDALARKVRDCVA